MLDAKNRTGHANVWHNEQNVEVEQYNNSNQGETIRNICHPGDDARVRVLVPEKRRWKDDAGGGNELAAKNTGKVQKRQGIRNEVTRKELGQQVTLVVGNDREDIVYRVPNPSI